MDQSIHHLRDAEGMTKIMKRIVPVMLLNGQLQ